MQVPVVSMSDGSGDEEPTHVDVVDEDSVEASDTESLGRDSDVASVVFSEVSTESVEEPAIRQVANARGISRGLAQLDGFHLTEILERRAHVMRVVPHVMRAAFCSAIRVACEEIFQWFQFGRHHPPGTRLEALSPSSPNALMPTPKRRVRSQERLGTEAGTVSRRKLARAGFAQHPHGRASFPKSGAKRSPP